MEHTENIVNEDLIKELIELLRQNNMNQQYNDLFEALSYIDVLQAKMDNMAKELSDMRKQLMEQDEKSIADGVKEVLRKEIEKAKAHLGVIRFKLNDVKESIRDTAKSIIAEVKEKGKYALNRVAEFTGMKEKLTSIRKNVRQGIEVTERTLERIENFGLGMRSAKRQMADSFRALGGKDKKEYSDEKKVSLTEMMKKPWKWQKNVYERMESNLDSAIGKLDKLAVSIQLKEMEQTWDKLYDKNGSITESEQFEIPIVAESMDYREAERDGGGGKSR